MTQITLTANAEGEPASVVVDGVGMVPGATVFDKMRFLETEADHIHQLILREPRGYPALCANILVPPCQPSADLGLIIFEQSAYAPMSGSNLICAVTVAPEVGIHPMQTPVTRLAVETPAGLVEVTATCSKGKVTAVTFRNVPAFAVHLDARLDVPGLGQITVDTAWGGMLFALADADALYLPLNPERAVRFARYPKPFASLRCTNCRSSTHKTRH